MNIISPLSRLVSILFKNQQGIRTSNKQSGPTRGFPEVKIMDGRVGDFGSFNRYLLHGFAASIIPARFYAFQNKNQILICVSGSKNRGKVHDKFKAQAQALPLPSSEMSKSSNGG